MKKHKSSMKSCLTQIFCLDCSYVLPTISKFSRAIQSPKLCFSDLATLKANCISEVTRFRNLWSLNEYYRDHWKLLNEARENTLLDENHISSFHERIAIPYIDTLLANINERLNMIPELSAFSVFDPAHKLYTEREVSTSAALEMLEPLIKHLSTDAYIKMVDGEACQVLGPVEGQEPLNSSPPFTIANLEALQAELPFVLWLIKQKKELGEWNRFEDCAKHFETDTVV